MEGELQKRFGRAVREYRRSLAISQEELADRLDHNRTYIGAIERGERNLTLCTVEKFAALLDLDPWVMLGPTDKFLSTLRRKKVSPQAKRRR